MPGLHFHDLRHVDAQTDAAHTHHRVGFMHAFDGGEQFFFGLQSITLAFDAHRDDFFKKFLFIGHELMQRWVDQADDDRVTDPSSTSFSCAADDLAGGDERPREGVTAGGIALLDHTTFDVLRAWETDRGPQHFAYDAWWHLNQNVLISSEWGTPSMIENGLNPSVADSDGDNLVERTNDLNRLIVKSVNATGRAFLTHTVLRQNTAMRIAVGNVLTTEQHLAAVFSLIRQELQSQRNTSISSASSTSSDSTRILSKS